MITKQKVIPWNKLLVLVSFPFVLGCFHQEEKKAVTKVYFPKDTIVSKIQTIDSITFRSKVISFLLKEQVLIRNNQIEEITNHIKFPLDGGYLYSQVYGDEFLKTLDKNEPFTKTIDRDVFIKNSDSILKPVFKYLMSNVDVIKKINDNKNLYQFVKKNKDKVWTIDFKILYGYKEFQIYWSVVTDNWEEEFSVFFRYRYEEDTFKLVSIGVIG